MVSCSKNWRKVFVIGILALVSLPVMALSLQSLSPKRWLDNQLKDKFGSEAASSWYQENTVAMLNKLGVENADQVPVRKLQVSVAGSAQVVHLDKWPALTSLTGIWINEPVLETFSEADRLWHLAHEASHYKLKHPLRFVIIDEIMIQAPVVTAITCVGLSVAAVSYVANKFNCLRPYATMAKIAAALGSGMWFGRNAIKAHAEGIQPIEFEFQKQCEREADLTAAEMLCNNGMAAIVEQHIQAIKKNIDAGMILLNGYNHPTFPEQFTYLNDYLNQWVAKHPEHVAESNSSSNSASEQEAL